MILTEVSANDIRQDYCKNSNDSIVEAERKKVVPYVDANCIEITCGKDGTFETYDSNEVYKVTGGMREFVRKLTKEEILKNAQEADKIFEECKHLFINK